MSAFWVAKNSSIPSSTVYFPICHGGPSALSASEDDGSRLTARTATTISALRVSITTNTTTLSGTSLTTRVNGADGNLAVSIGTGLTGWFEDTTHSDSIAVGDTIAYKYVDNGEGATVGVAIVEVLSDAAVMVYGGNNTGSSLAVANATRYYGLTQNAPNSSEVVCQLTTRSPGTWSNLQLYASSNVRTNATTFKSRVNNADGNQAISIGATTTGLFEDTTHSDTLAGTDSVSVSAATGSGTQSLQIQRISSQVIPSGADFMLFGDDTGPTIGSAAAVRYFAFAYAKGGAVESGTQAKAQLAGTMSYLQIRVTTGASGTTTYISRVNTANGNQSISIAGSTSGLFEDTTHSDTLAIGDLFNAKCTFGGTQQVVGPGVLFTVVAASTFAPMLTLMGVG